MQMFATISAYHLTCSKAQSGLDKTVEAPPAAERSSGNVDKQQVVKADVR
jgi:hypothetical protein